MVGDVDCREAKIGAELHIVRGFDALGNDWQVGHLSDLVQGFDAVVGGVAGFGRVPEAVVASANTFNTSVVNGKEDSAETVALDAVQLVL